VPYCSSDNYYDSQLSAADHPLDYPPTGAVLLERHRVLAFGGNEQGCHSHCVRQEDAHNLVRDNQVALAGCPGVLLHHQEPDSLATSGKL